MISVTHWNEVYNIHMRYVNMKHDNIMITTYNSEPRAHAKNTLYKPLHATHIPRINLLFLKFSTSSMLNAICDEGNGKPTNKKSPPKDKLGSLPLVFAELEMSFAMQTTTLHQAERRMVGTYHT